MLGKKDLRVKNKEIRSQLNQNIVREKSAELCARLLESSEYKNTDCILAYAAIQNEIDISELVKRALSDGKIVFYPKVFGDVMEFYRINDLNELSPGAFGVPEPTTIGNSFSNENGIILVPGLAFSSTKHRIGYGKGYYDKYLSKHTRLRSIGVGYDFQFDEDFLADEYDVPLHVLYSNKGIVNKSGK